MQGILCDIAMICIGILTFWNFKLEKRVNFLEEQINDLQRDK